MPDVCNRPCDTLALLRARPRVGPADYQPSGSRTSVRRRLVHTADARCSLEEVLRRRISLNLRQVPVAEALKAIVRAAKLEMSYSPSLLPLGRVVSLKADNITVAAALTETLLDVPVDVVLGRAGTLALVGRTHLVPAHSGTVIGHVTDAETGTPLIGATVAVQGTSLTVSTGQDGAYRILGLAQGLHTLRARYIGYGAGEAVVAVTGAETVTQNFALSRAVQTLEEVVTTGTVVPTEVKALPTPIAVVDAEDIERRRPVDLKVLLRQAVPAAVSWFEPGAPLVHLLPAPRRDDSHRTHRRDQGADRWRRSRGSQQRRGRPQQYRAD